MDFGAIGETMGMAIAVKRARSAVDAADAEIAYGNEVIAQKNRRISDLEREVAELKAKLNVQLAHTEGLVHQARAVRAELTKADPKNRLVQKTGKMYDGAPQLVCHTIFEQVFDQKAAELGLPGPHYKYRPRAK